jgi:hypothetical protein
MADCTLEGLLYGGPDYFRHGDFPCIHHTFTHAKAIATTLDRGEAELRSTERYSLLRDEVYPVRSFPEIGTHLASVGDWRATVTENDWEYVETVQSGSGGGGGGHATGGALSILFHKKLGPILTASMTEYRLIEISNQQTFRDAPHMTLTPRIECAGEQTYTSLNDLSASLKVDTASSVATFTASGRLQTSTHQMPRGGDAHYRLEYLILANQVDIDVRLDSVAPLPALAKFILPVISNSEEQVEVVDSRTLQIRKVRGNLVVRTDSAAGFEPVPAQRSFNLVPGFECLPLVIRLTPGESVRVNIREGSSS